MRQLGVVFVLTAVCLVSVAGLATAAEKSFSITVEAGEFDRTNVPIKVDIELPPDLTDAASATLSDGTNQLTGQITSPGLLSAAFGKAEQNRRELHFVLPELKAGKSISLTATVSDKVSTAGDGFTWSTEPGKYAQLNFNGKPVLRYMHEALDESSSARREETYKVFHHVFDPSGEEIVTKGPGGRYTHHRGLFFGFNRVAYGGNKVDIWHCRGAHQAHREFVDVEAGPVVGRHLLAIDWHGAEQKVFAQELRELTVYNVPGGHLIEFASRLNSTVGPVRLDGDPQHAGFHFRASNDVAAKTARQTYYLRPDGKDAPGKTRNWPGNKQHVNLAWNAQSFVLGEQRFTCCYLDRPENPKEARFSERDYGRFGSYFEYDLDKDNPLELNYRIWLQDEEMTAGEVEALSHDFVSPPSAQVKS